MTSFGMFSSSIAALNSHAAAFGAIGENIANVSSEGYKANDVLFGELVHGRSQTAFQTFNGMAPINRTLINHQGEVLNTGNNLDVGITGSGFFVVNSQFDQSDETLLTRAGSFQRVVDTNNQVFLSDVDGNFLQGWPADANGGFTIGADVNSLGPIRVDPGSAVFAPVASTTAAMRVNLDASAATGTVFNSSVNVIDNLGATNSLNFEFTKNAAVNTWDVVVTTPDGAVTAVPPLSATFDATGAIVSPTSSTTAITWTNPAAAASALNVDLSGLTQFSGASIIQSVTSNGNPAGTLADVHITDAGVVEGIFTNGLSRGLFKLPVATVRNTDALVARSGTHFALGAETGEVRLLQADLTEIASLVEESLEHSAVDLSEEFTKMVVTQQAYNNAAQTIRAVDEMFQVAATMKG